MITMTMCMRLISNAELVQRCLDGDHRACNALVRRCQALVYG